MIKQRVPKIQLTKIISNRKANIKKRDMTIFTIKHNKSLCQPEVATFTPTNKLLRNFTLRPEIISKRVRLVFKALIFAQLLKVRNMQLSQQNNFITSEKGSLNGSIQHNIQPI